VTSTPQLPTEHFSGFLRGRDGAVHLERDPSVWGDKNPAPPSRTRIVPCGSLLALATPCPRSSKDGRLPRSSSIELRSRSARSMNQMRQSEPRNSPRQSRHSMKARTSRCQSTSAIDESELQRTRYGPMADLYEETDSTHRRVGDGSKSHCDGRIRLNHHSERHFAQADQAVIAFCSHRVSAREMRCT
jgi:hypothetical protein